MRKRMSGLLRIIAVILALLGFLFLLLRFSIFFFPILGSLLSSEINGISEIGFIMGLTIGYIFGLIFMFQLFIAILNKLGPKKVSEECQKESFPQKDEKEILGFIFIDKWFFPYRILYFAKSGVVIARAPPFFLKYYAGKDLGELLQICNCKDIESILSTDSMNFLIPYSEIAKIQLKEPCSLRNGEIIISTINKEFRFNIGRKWISLRKYDFEFLRDVHPFLSNK
jgi:hypothetical protein